MSEQPSVIQEILKRSTTLPPWQSDALRRLLVQGDLLPEDKAELAQMAKKSAGILADKPVVDPIPLSEKNIPEPPKTGETAILTKMHSIENVNALLQGQTIRFGHNGVTVIYGSNGSGKSGYSRVLKRACRARDTENILPNIFSDSSTSQGRPKAVFELLDQEQKEFSVDWREGADNPDVLAQFSVFDSRCERVFVDDANEIYYIPYGLDVLPSLATFIDELKEDFIREKTELEMFDVIVEGLKGDHEVGRLIDTLSPDTKNESIERLALYTDEDEALLVDLTQRFKELEVNDPKNLAKISRRLKERVGRLHNNIENACRILNPDWISDLKKLHEENRTATEAARLASSSMFSDQPLTGVGTDPWRELFTAAKAYSIQIAYPEKPFPFIDEGSRCVLCMQELSIGAKERLQAFNSFIQDQTAQKAKETQKALQEKIQQLESIEHLVFENELIEEIMDRNGELLAPLPKTLDTIKKAVPLCREALADDTKWDLVSFPQVETVGYLSKFIVELEQYAADQEALEDTGERAKLEVQHRELSAKKQLATYKDQVLSKLHNLRVATQFGALIATLNSRSITDMATQVTEVVSTNALQSSLQTELNKLGVKHINLHFQQSGKKGQTRHKLKIPEVIKPEKLSLVLSEGEQSVVAIGSFLAEVGLSSESTGIILDDPVSSLDHIWREKISERIVEEGKNRQVIIFTHNIVFLLELQRFAAMLRVPLHVQTLVRQGKLCGKCIQDQPWDTHTVKKRITAIRELAIEARSAYDEDPDGSQYRQKHDDIFGFLRETWEKVVEEKLLNDVVRRYSGTISTKKLNAVYVSDEDYEKVLWGYSECSRQFKGHHKSPELQYRLAAPDDIDQSINELAEYVTRIDKRQDDLRRVRASTTEAPPPTLSPQS